MKVLLVAINAKFIHSNPAVYFLRDYAFANISFVDALQNLQIDVAEYTINQQFDEILIGIFKQKPEIIGFSCYIWNISLIQQLIVELHKVLPKTEIWLGGPEVSYNSAQVLLDYPQVDLVIRGEGEEPFYRLLQMRLNHDPAPISNITYRDEAGMPRETLTKDLPDLNNISFPYHDLEVFQNRIIYYESSRGCPFSCSYCLSSASEGVRFRDLELVKKELQYLIDAHVFQVKFVDRTFNCHKERAREIWSFLQEKDLGYTNFHFEIAADLLEEEDLELLKTLRPGLIQFEIGVQSTNPQTLEEITRMMDFERIKQVVGELKAGKNIHQHLDLIAGLPYEDFKCFANSFNDVYVLEPEQLQLGFLKVLNGSVLAEKAQGYQLVFQSRAPYEVLSTKWLSFEEILRLKQVEEMVEVYYNSRQFVNTLRFFVHYFDTPFLMYDALGDFYDKRSYVKVNHTRQRRYEILLEFATEHLNQLEFVVEHLNLMDDFQENLILDYYLRENAKKRPGFAGEETVSKEEANQFYECEVQTFQYLKGYEEFDKRQIRKMTHLERIGGKLYLFDYLNKNNWSKDARHYHIDILGEKT
ncbi:MAG: DUF4080 domain-containing protein [Lachnospiraceae bacterium]|nr:DUF4080 domain-containing protein [Lachnospiraceae bacterium]